MLLGLFADGDLGCIDFLHAVCVPEQAAESNDCMFVAKARDGTSVGGRQPEHAGNDVNSTPRVEVVCGASDMSGGSNPLENTVRGRKRLHVL